MPIECAMVFAAGLGTRLRPLTHQTPKPLVRVGGKALLDHTIERLAAAGITRMVVNTHYLAEQVEAHIRERFAALDIQISREDTLLDTGGGIVKALALLQDSPFFSVNSDVLWFDVGQPALSRLAEGFDPQRMDALLLLHPLERAVGYRGPGNFALADDGGLVRTAQAPHVFTGVQIVTPSLFADRKAEPFSLRALYQAAESEDGRLSRMFGLVHEGDWLHVGAPEELAEANAFMAARGLG